MTSKLPPKQPHKKDAEYMRKAYMYSAILLIFGLLGSLLLAERIVTTQAKQTAEIEALEQEKEEQEEPDRNRSG